ncbi:MAG: ADP-ribosyltransferase [Lachnospiraceae bacterium]|nr:ADP-ribosyltransferase [Lachnospiraceae bacterium]
MELQVKIDETEKLTFVQKKEKYGEICCGRILEDYRCFNSHEDATRLGQMDYEEWGNKCYEFLKKVENKTWEHERPSICAIQRYCGNEFQYINRYLREGKKKELRNGVLKTTDEYHRKLDKLIQQMKFLLRYAPSLSENIVVYKKVSEAHINALIEKNKLNEPLKDKAFMSTSLYLVKDKRCSISLHYKGDNVLKIYVSKGTNGVYPYALNKNWGFGCNSESESEYLISPETEIIMIKYPYWDNKLERRIFECKLVQHSKQCNELELDLESEELIQEYNDIE